MKFSYIWISIGDGTTPYSELGHFLRSGDEVRFHLVPELPPSMAADAEGMVGWASRDGSADQLWEYLQDRAMGGHSSATRSRDVQAKSWDEAAAKVSRLQSRVQLGG